MFGTDETGKWKITVLIRRKVRKGIGEPKTVFSAFNLKSLCLMFALWTPDSLILDLEFLFYVNFPTFSRILRSGIEYLASKTSNVCFKLFCFNPFLGFQSLNSTVRNTVLQFHWEWETCLETKLFASRHHEGRFIWDQLGNNPIGLLALLKPSRTKRNLRTFFFEINKAIKEIIKFKK